MLASWLWKRAPYFEWPFRPGVFKTCSSCLTPPLSSTHLERIHCRCRCLGYIWKVLCYRDGPLVHLLCGHTNELWYHLGSKPGPASPGWAGISQSLPLRCLNGFIVQLLRPRKLLMWRQDCCVISGRCHTATTLYSLGLSKWTSPGDGCSTWPGHGHWSLYVRTDVAICLPTASRTTRCRGNPLWHPVCQAPLGQQVQ